MAVFHGTKHDDNFDRSSDTSDDTFDLFKGGSDIYHAIQRTGRDYQVTAEDEPPRWRALFGTFPVEHIQPGAKLYVYSAVFAPDRLATSIEHRWEWRDPKTGAWRAAADGALHPLTADGKTAIAPIPSRRAPKAGTVAGEYRHR